MITEITLSGLAVCCAAINVLMFIRMKKMREYYEIKSSVINPESSACAQLAIKANQYNKLMYPSGIPSDTMIAYTDGSYRGVEDCIGSGSLMFYDDMMEIHISSNDDHRLKNVLGELNAATYVISRAMDLNIKHLDIYYDYNGIEFWATGKWEKTKVDAAKAYKRIYKLACDNNIDIRFHKLQAHSGNILHDIVDKFAFDGACGVSCDLIMVDNVLFDSKYL